jgi:hypothetical protein
VFSRAPSLAVAGACFPLVCRSHKLISLDSSYFPCLRNASFNFTLTITMIHPSAHKTTTSIPHEFTCPLTLELMKHPVMTRSGMCFERSAICEWLLHHNNTNPLTREHLGPQDLVSHRALKARIEAWKCANQQRLHKEDIDTDDTESCSSTNDDTEDDDDDASDELLFCLAQNFQKDSQAARPVSEEQPPTASRPSFLSQSRLVRAIRRQR